MPLIVLLHEKLMVDPEVKFRVKDPNWSISQQVFSELLYASNEKNPAENVKWKWDIVSAMEEVLIWMMW